MTLSLDKLNKKSPYALIKLSELTFSFVTDQGIHYEVGFYKDTIFMKDGEAYHFFIDNSEDEHGSHDPKIVDVVITLLEEFFAQEPSVMLYICDPTDNRQAARNRLYVMWYHTYAMSHHLTMYTDSIELDGVAYYTGILMKPDHPHHDEILVAFQQFLKFLPQRIQVGEK